MSLKESKSISLKELNKKINYLESVIRAIPGCIYWKDLNGVYLGCNQIFLDITGLCSQEEVIGKTDKELCWFEQADVLRKHDLSVIQNGKMQILEEEVSLADGDKRLYSVVKAPLKDDSDNIIGVVGTSVDITYRRETEEKLHKAQKVLLKDVSEKAQIVSSELDNLITYAPDFIYWKDKNSVHLGCNERFADFAGLTKEEVIGKTDFDFPWKEQAKSFQKDDAEVIQSGQPKLNIEDIMFNSEGKKAIVITNKVPLRDKDGKVVGVFGIATDVTPLKETEEELRKALLKTEKASKAKSEFIANMSHDIRTPITGILGLAKLLKDDAYTETNREYAQLLIGATEQLLSLLNEIIDVVRIEEGKLKNGKKDFDLVTVVENNIELLQPALQEKGLRLHYQIDPKVPHYLFGHQLYLDRILLNLLGNAVKFTKEGLISIAVAVKNLKEMDEEVVLQIVVEDTGIGIPDDKKEVIFEHFSRLSPSYEGHYTGYGLGLYTVKRYLEAMNGHVDVESELGKGSRFILTIPFKIGKAVSSEINRVYERDNAWGRFSSELVKKISSEETEILSKQKAISSIEKEMPNERIKILKEEIPSKKEIPNMAEKILSKEDNRQALLSPTGNSLEPSAKTISRILLVEDNQLAALMATRLLAERNCEIVHVQTGADALERVTQERFDLILMDLGLPDQSGIEVTQKIRTHANHSNLNTPIVALTGHLTEDKREECLAVGMQDMLKKPLTALTGQQLLMKYGVFALNSSNTQKSEEATEFSVIDLERGMNILGGDLASAKEALEMLDQSLPTDYQQILTHYNEKDYEAMYQSVHRLYGGLCYCGTPGLQDAIQLLKQALLDKKIQELPRLMKHFKEEIERFQQAYQHLKLQDDF